MKILKAVAIGFFSLIALLVAMVFIFDDTEAIEQPVLGTYIIDGDDSLFEGYSDERVEIWTSSKQNTLTNDITERTLVAKLERGTEVKLLQRDDKGYYCQVRHSSNEGWLACEWLQ